MNRFSTLPVRLKRSLSARTATANKSGNTTRVRARARRRRRSIDVYTLDNESYMDYTRRRAAVGVKFTEGKKCVWVAKLKEGCIRDA